MDKNYDEASVAAGVIAEDTFDDYDPFDVSEEDIPKEPDIEVDDDYNPFEEYDHLVHQRIIDRAFNGIKGHGFDAHAYKATLDNEKILELKDKKVSLRGIARQLGCSPNTIKYRLGKMGYK